MDSKVQEICRHKYIHSKLDLEKQIGDVHLMMPQLLEFYREVYEALVFQFLCQLESFPTPENLSFVFCSSALRNNPRIDFPQLENITMPRIFCTFG